jgi:hypothetical protein
VAVRAINTRQTIRQTDMTDLVNFMFFPPFL